MKPKYRTFKMQNKRTDLIFKQKVYLPVSVRCHLPRTYVVKKDGVNHMPTHT